MAHDDNLDSLGHWVGTQSDFGHDVPESADAFPGSLTADDQEEAMRGSIAVGDVTRVKDESDSLDGTRSAPEAPQDGSEIPVTAAGDKVTADGKKAGDGDAAPVSAAATSEAPADKVADSKPAARRKAS